MVVVREAVMSKEKYRRASWLALLSACILVWLGVLAAGPSPVILLNLLPAGVVAFALALVWRARSGWK